MKYVALVALFSITGCTIGIGPNGLTIVPAGPSASNVSSSCITRCMEQSAGNSSFSQPNQSYGICANICQGSR